VADIRLHEAVCRQRPYLWPKVGYVKLSVTVGSMKLCVDKDLKCGR
jgi:hypothetical protein